MRVLLHIPLGEYRVSIHMMEKVAVRSEDAFCFLQVMVSEQGVPRVVGFP